MSTSKQISYTIFIHLYLFCFTIIVAYYTYKNNTYMAKSQTVEIEVIIAEENLTLVDIYYQKLRENEWY